MKIKIERITNGYILFWEEEIEDKEFKEFKEAIEESDDLDGEKKAMTNVLYKIAEFFGFHYQKFEKDNLSIKWNKKGHKYEK